MTPVTLDMSGTVSTTRRDAVSTSTRALSPRWASQRRCVAGSRSA